MPDQAQNLANRNTCCTALAQAFQRVGNFFTGDKLTPPLGVLQDRGCRVALLTDGRMSGASGKVPAAIHVTPEAVDNGPIARLRDGDMIRLDADAGTLSVLVDDAEFAAREPVSVELSDNEHGMGRELFANFRALAGRADTGASVLYG